jgi:hypothetical protein
MYRTGENIVIDSAVVTPEQASLLECIFKARYLPCEIRGI